MLCGEAAGAGTQTEFTRVVRLTLAWASVVALIIAGLYGIFGSQLAASFSTAPAVIATSRRYVGWAVLMPLAGFASYVFDGVFVGAGWTRAMLLTMAAALAAFLVLLVVLQRFGDGGLWLAFCFFLFAARRRPGRHASGPGATKLRASSCRRRKDRQLSGRRARRPLTTTAAAGGRLANASTTTLRPQLRRATPAGAGRSTAFNGLLGG